MCFIINCFFQTQSTLKTICGGSYKIVRLENKSYTCLNVAFLKCEINNK